MKSKLCVIFLLSLFLLPTVILAQPEIPDHCFVNGEVDCTKPECNDICFTKPTPGHEMPIVAPPSGLENDTIEEGATRIVGRPRLVMPFHEDPPVMDTSTKIKNSEKIYIPYDCPQKEDAILKLARNDLKYYQDWLKDADKRIEENFYNRKDMIRSKMEYESDADSLTFTIAASACYTIDKKCVKNPDKKITQMISDYYDTISSLKFVRERVYEYMEKCTDMDPRCLKSTTYSTLSCDRTNGDMYSFNCIGFKTELESYERLTAEKDSELKKLMDLQCRP